VDAFAADFSTEFSLRDLGEVRCDFGGGHEFERDLGGDVGRGQVSEVRFGR
jgi:hypothetical protein